MAYPTSTLLQHLWSLQDYLNVTRQVGEDDGAYYGQQIGTAVREAFTRISALIKSVNSADVRVLDWCRRRQALRGVERIHEIIDDRMVEWRDRAIDAELAFRDAIRLCREAIRVFRGHGATLSEFSNTGVGDLSNAATDISDEMDALVVDTGREAYDQEYQVRRATRLEDRSAQHLQKVRQDRAHMERRSESWSNVGVNIAKGNDD
jgi:hypothetical protein